MKRIGGLSHDIQMTPSQVNNITHNLGASIKTAKELSRLQKLHNEIMSIIDSLGRATGSVLRAPEEIMKIMNKLSILTQVFIVVCIVSVIVRSIYSVALKRHKSRALETATNATREVVGFARGGRQMMNQSVNLSKKIENIVYENAKKARERLEKIRDELLRNNIVRTNTNIARLTKLEEIAEKHYKEAMSELNMSMKNAALTANQIIGGNAGSKLIQGAALAASHILYEARHEQTMLNKPSTATRAIATGVAVATGGASAGAMAAVLTSNRGRSPNRRNTSTNRNNRRSSTLLRLGQS